MIPIFISLFLCVYIYTCILREKNYFYIIQVVYFNTFKWRRHYRYDCTSNLFFLCFGPEDLERNEGGRTKVDVFAFVVSVFTFLLPSSRCQLWKKATWEVFVAFFNWIRFCRQALQLYCKGILVIYRSTKQPLETHLLSRQEEKTYYFANENKEAHVWKVLLNTPSGNIRYFHFKQQFPRSVFTFIEYLTASKCNTKSYMLFGIFLLLCKFHF